MPAKAVHDIVIAKVGEGGIVRATGDPNAKSSMVVRPLSVSYVRIR